MRKRAIKVRNGSHVTKKYNSMTFLLHNKKRKIEVTGFTKSSNDQAMMSQNTLLNKDVTICRVCFRAEDTDSKQTISWICCSNCLMCVHTQCANIKFEVSADYIYICQYCSKKK